MVKFRQKDFAKVMLNNPIRMKRLALTKFERGNRFIKDEATKAAMNPGKYTSDSIKYAVKNPATSASVAIPVPGATVAVNRGEQLIKNKVGVYNKTTETLGRAYENSGLPKIVEPAVNTVTNAVKYL